MTPDLLVRILIGVFMLGVFVMGHAQNKLNEITWAELREHRARIKELEGKTLETTP